ncbi:putative protein kinase RLK-Pelle-LysM family [Lupinus albus]|uniref:Protein kinase domain-containing protein n=1 Tax=Lupinus albus TaxID=3870 RepID=A0A6A4QNX3_LUPAL|nr:putative protein kinase RLK-Pelle-LysM family [Lupinus albus]
MAPKISISCTIISLLLLPFLISQTHSQQQYVNNKQLKCEDTTNSTYGNICNSNPSCQSYLTFISSSPLYNTPSSISYLLNSTPSLIAQSNNITDVNPIPTNTIITVPVNCSCFNNLYQHNTTYTLKTLGETYFSIANNTYQALTTCQALIAQNTYEVTNLTVGLNLHVPLRCACPTKKQLDEGFKYLLTYLVSEGESVASIAEIFGVDEQSVRDANELSPDSMIFFFTPLLKWVIVGVPLGVVLLAILLVFFICFYRRRREPPLPVVESTKILSDSTTTEGTKKVSETTPTSESWSLSSEGVRYAVESLTLYKFEELEKATGSFSEENRIKGSVYRASFKGDDAAVKILKGDVSGEINILKKINHTNIIRLSGFCVYKGNTYLVYEFAENDSLDDWLHSVEKKYKNSLSLSWIQRVQIAHDVADALNYLHNYVTPPHVHKNLKSGNVLLDGNFRGKVSNFGLARVVEDEGEEGGFQLTRHVVGTQGYMAPEYIENGMITPKMDVFAFGVVVLELLSGKEAVVSGEQLLSATINQVLEGDSVRQKLKGFMDPSLKDSILYVRLGSIL